MISAPGEYSAGQFTGFNGVDGGMSDELSEPTGRYVVVLADKVLGDEGASKAALQSIARISDVLSARDFRDRPSPGRGQRRRSATIPVAASGL